MNVFPLQEKKTTTCVKAREGWGAGGSVVSHVFKIYSNKTNLELFLPLLAIDRRVTASDVMDG